MAKRIGKYYITLNNPRNLLLQIKELKDNWNELEEWLKIQKRERRLSNDVYRFTAYDSVLLKMKDLEGE